MLGLSFSELALLAFIGILFLKPDELRRMARKAGGWMADIQRMSREFTRELVREADLQDLRDEVRKIKTDIRKTLDAPAASPDEAAAAGAPSQLADEKPIRADGEREQAEGGQYQPAFPESASPDPAGKPAAGKTIAETAEGEAAAAPASKAPAA